MLQTVAMIVMAAMLVILVFQNMKLTRKVEQIKSENLRLRWDIQQVDSKINTVLTSINLNTDLTTSLGRNVDTLHQCVRTLIDALSIRYAPHLRIVDKNEDAM